MNVLINKFRNQVLLIKLAQIWLFCLTVVMLIIYPEITFIVLCCVFTFAAFLVLFIKLIDAP